MAGEATAVGDPAQGEDPLASQRVSLLCPHRAYGFTGSPAPGRLEGDPVTALQPIPSTIFPVRTWILSTRFSSWNLSANNKL